MRKRSCPFFSLQAVDGVARWRKWIQPSDGCWRSGEDPRGSTVRGIQPKRAPGLHFLFEHSLGCFGMQTHCHWWGRSGQGLICVKSTMEEGGKIDFRAWHLPVVCWAYVIIFDRFKNSVICEKFSFHHKVWPVQNVLQLRKRVPEIQ